MTTADNRINSDSELTTRKKHPPFFLFLVCFSGILGMALLFYSAHTAKIQRAKWRDAYVATIFLQNNITECLENHQGHIDACDSFEKIGTTEWKNSGLDNVNVSFIPGTVSLLLTLKNDENDECQVAATRRVSHGRPSWRPVVVGGSIHATFNDLVSRGDWRGKVPCGYSHTGFDPDSFPTPTQRGKNEVQKEWVCRNGNPDDCRFLPIKELSS